MSTTTTKPAMASGDRTAASARFTTRPGSRWSSAATSASWGSCVAWDGGASPSAWSTTSFVHGSDYAATPLAHVTADTAEWIPRPPCEVELVG